MPAASSRTKPYPYRSAYGTYQIGWFQESTTVSTSVIAVGDVCQLDENVSTGNHRVRKTSTLTNVPNALSTSFVGVAVSVPFDPASSVSATAPGSTAQSRYVGVALATPQTEFWFLTKSSGIVSTVIGQRKALAYDSTLGIHYVDLGNSTAADAGVIVTAVEGDGTDTNNPVIARFISTGVARQIGSPLS